MSRRYPSWLDCLGAPASLPRSSAGTRRTFKTWVLLLTRPRNLFPYTTFNWVGLDGSEVLSHMTPVVNYCSQCGIDDIRKGYTNHQNLDVTSDSMLLFGNGDGGGGPTPQMLERLRRARAVGEVNDASGSELPLIRMGATMSAFFDFVRAKTTNGEVLPDWYGELYLEFHRGVSRLPHIRLTR